MDRKKETRQTYHSQRVSEQSTLSEILALTPAQFLGAILAGVAFVGVPAIVAAIYQSITF